MLILELVMLKNQVPILPTGLAIFTLLANGYLNVLFIKVWLVFSNHESFTLLIAPFSDPFVNISWLLFSGYPASLSFVAKTVSLKRPLVFITRSSRTRVIFISENSFSSEFPGFPESIIVALFNIFFYSFI